MAQQGANPCGVQAPHSEAPRATAARLDGSVRVDGQLSETQWRSAQPLTQFTQLDPQEGRPATERSDIRILYDDEAYTSVRYCTTAKPHAADLGGAT